MQIFKEHESMARFTYLDKTLLLLKTLVQEKVRHIISNL